MRVATLDGAGTPFDWPEAIGYGRQPFASFPAGAWQCVAGPNGAAVGCFGWIDPASGKVSNSLIEGALMGIVLPHANRYNLWERVYIRRSFPFSQMVTRPGVGCVVASVGDFNLKFPNGGEAGTQVFADPSTGLPYSGNTTGSYIQTSWTLTQSGRPGTRLRISQMVQPFN
jgi:hypothetical protein